MRSRGWLLLLFVASPILAQDELVCGDLEREAYLHDVSQAVAAHWKVPYLNRTITCRVLIRQNFRGEVLDVGIAKCGEDPTVHKSVIDAGYQASPVPLPKNKACFSRDIIIDVISRTQDAQ